MNFDYAVHSDFLIHWTGKDIDYLYDKQWYKSDKSKTNKNCDVSGRYIKRLHDTLKYGLWMTVEKKSVVFRKYQYIHPKYSANLLYRVKSLRVKKTC